MPPTPALHDRRPSLKASQAFTPSYGGDFQRQTQREAEPGHSAIIPGKANSTKKAEGCQNMPSNPDVTMLLQAWRGGDSQALERLVPLVRTEIHRLAGRYMKRERPGHVSTDDRPGQ